MKILAIGDPHGDIEKIKKLKLKLKKIDIILITGDLGSAKLLRAKAFENMERKKLGLPEKKYSPIQEKKAFMEAYTSSIKLVKYLSLFAPVFIIFGNVESSDNETKAHSKKIGLPLPCLCKNLNSMKNVKVINNHRINFKGVKIGGLKYFLDSCWVREFNPSDFKEKLVKAKKQTEQAKKVLSRFESLDILLCHQPPYGVLDQVHAKFAPKNWQGKHAGSKVILNYIRSKKPGYVFCGHIHESEGMKKIGKTRIFNLGEGGVEVLEV